MSQKSYKINVTERIIARAKRGHSHVCIVAEAIRETLSPKVPGLHSIDVTAETIRFNMENEDGEIVRRIQDTPAFVAKQIIKFDDEGPENMEPFEFVLYGRSCMISPVIKRPSLKRKKSKKRIVIPKNTRSHCVKTKSRRRHGLKMVIDRN